MKRLLLLLLVLMCSSCSVSKQSVYEPCTFSVYEDKIEIIYHNSGNHIIIVFKEGETFDKAYNRYYRELRRREHETRRN